jgi:hypothetical protein
MKHLDITARLVLAAAANQRATGRGWALRGSSTTVPPADARATFPAPIDAVSAAGTGSRSAAPNSPRKARASPCRWRRSSCASGSPASQDSISRASAAGSSPST